MEAFALFNQRQLEIIDLLQTEDKVSVSELTQRFGVSLVTVRQDLKKMEDQGVLKRTHGGAIPVDNGYDTSTRMWNNYEQKLRIAQRDVYKRQGSWCSRRPRRIPTSRPRRCRRLWRSPSPGRPP